jgi:hypothetical protein
VPPAGVRVRDIAAAQRIAWTLLYYTGSTRLAKNILQPVLGRYLDRDRRAMATLAEIEALAPQAAEAMARKDLAAFGRMIDVAWRLNQQLDPKSSNDDIEELLARLSRYLHGAKLLGAGGGGFLLLVRKSPEDAGRVRSLLETAPPNELARCFDFEVSRRGLELSACWTQRRDISPWSFACDLRTRANVHAIPLPKSWSSHVKSAALQIISLAQFAVAYTRGWAADSAGHPAGGWSWPWIITRAESWARRAAARRHDS